MKISGINSCTAFCAYKSSFSKKLEENLNAKSDERQEELLGDEFADVIMQSMTPYNYVGGGSFNKVYKIDDYYVMRIPYNSILNTEYFYLGAMKLPENTVLNRAAEGLKCYYGNPVARFGNVNILRNAMEDKIVMSCGLDNNMLLLEDKLKYFSKYLEEFANLPQSAYDRLAFDFKYMNNYRTKNNFTYSYDILNAKNFMKVADEIRVVDDIDNEEVLFHDKNRLTTLLQVFFQPDRLLPAACLEEQDIKNMHLIFKKCVLAAVKVNLPYDDIEMLAPRYNAIMFDAGITARSSNLLNILKRVPENPDGQDISNLDEMLSEFLNKYSRI